MLIIALPINKTGMSLYCKLIVRMRFSLLMVFINGILIQRATNTVAYYGCHNGTDSGGYVKFTPKYIIVGGEGGGIIIVFKVPIIFFWSLRSTSKSSKS